MEFDPPQNIKNEISEEEQIAAETRKKTLNPMNPFIKPEDMPDPIAVNTPQANIQRDSEDTARAESLIQPSTGVQPIPTSQSSRGRILLVALVLVLPLAAITLVLMLPKTQ